jgi:LPXTG-motif cell wall-anchored protein
LKYAGKETNATTKFTISEKKEPIWSKIRWDMNTILIIVLILLLIFFLWKRKKKDNPESHPPKVHHKK